MVLESKFVKALDEWRPCYPNQEVLVSLIEDPEQMFRVCVWGEDDFGMEKEFTHLGEARDCYASIKGPISVSSLQQAGFVRA